MWRKKEKQLDEKLFLIRFTDSTICNTQSGEGPKKPNRNWSHRKPREITIGASYLLCWCICVRRMRSHLRWTEEMYKKSWCVMRAHCPFAEIDVVQFQMLCVRLSRFIFIVSLSPIPPDPNYTSTQTFSHRERWERSLANASTRQLSQSYRKTQKPFQFQPYFLFFRSFNVSLVRTLVVTTHLHSDASHQVERQNTHTRSLCAVNRRHTDETDANQKLMRNIRIPNGNWILVSCSFALL